MLLPWWDLSGLFLSHSSFTSTIWALIDCLSLTCLRIKQYHTVVGCITFLTQQPEAENTSDLTIRTSRLITPAPTTDKTSTFSLLLYPTYLQNGQSSRQFHEQPQNVNFLATPSRDTQWDLHPSLHFHSTNIRPRAEILRHGCLHVPTFEFSSNTSHMSLDIRRDKRRLVQTGLILVHDRAQTVPCFAPWRINHPWTRIWWSIWGECHRCWNLRVGNQIW